MKRYIFIFLWMVAASYLQAQTKYPAIVIETNYGTMKAMLYDDTPRHNNHYLKLINQGYFNGTLFHRVVKNFVIQGGAQDSRNAPAGVQIGGGRTDMELMPEFRENRFHKKGALAAPRKGDNENPQKKLGCLAVLYRPRKGIHTGAAGFHGDGSKCSYQEPAYPCTLRTAQRRTGAPESERPK